VLPEMRLREMRLVSAGVGLALSDAIIARLQWRLLGDNEEQIFLLSPSPVRTMHSYIGRLRKNSSFWHL
jgi:hypothetical protein